MKRVGKGQKSELLEIREIYGARKTTDLTTSLQLRTNVSPKVFKIGPPTQAQGPPTQAQGPPTQTKGPSIRPKDSQPITSGGEDVRKYVRTGGRTEFFPLFNRASAQKAIKRAIYREREKQRRKRGERSPLFKSLGAGGNGFHLFSSLLPSPPSFVWRGRAVSKRYVVVC